MKGEGEDGMDIGNLCPRSGQELSLFNAGRSTTGSIVHRIEDWHAIGVAIGTGKDGSSSLSGIAELG